jgi:murein tripeptide amidase MpaA
MSELVENNAAHPQYTENLDWYFMPVINPDGYEFTHTNVSSFAFQI